MEYFNEKNDEVNYRVKWEIEKNGDYESGLIKGRKMAESFLSLMGSGQIAVHNVMLPAVMASWTMLNRNTSDPEKSLNLDGQKDGFLGRLSEFLVVAAYTNNCGLSEENGFNPAKVKKPDGL